MLFALDRTWELEPRALEKMLAAAMYIHASKQLIKLQEGSTEGAWLRYMPNVFRDV